MASIASGADIADVGATREAAAVIEALGATGSEKFCRPLLNAGFEDSSIDPCSLLDRRWLLEAGTAASTLGPAGELDAFASTFVDEAETLLASASRIVGAGADTDDALGIFAGAVAFGATSSEAGSAAGVADAIA